MKQATLMVVRFNVARDSSRFGCDAVSLSE